MKNIFKIFLCGLLSLFTQSCNTESGNGWDLDKIKAEGEAFLAENAKKEGVTVTESGLQYEVLKMGDGKMPTAADAVRCNYKGMLIDGKVFDQGNDLKFGLMEVIRGWTEGVQLMKEGSIFRFYIPYQLAYGSYGAGQAIPPYAALIFEVELLEVVE